MLAPEQSKTVFKSFHIERGAVDAALARGRRRRRGRVPAAAPGAGLHRDERGRCWFEADGTLVTLGSLQCPHYVVKALKAAFGLPEEKVRVIQAVTGGGFGGKEEYPNVICAHAALLARKAGPAREDHLRPPRGHGGDDQAPPGADPLPQRGDARRPPGRAGHRDPDGRRRLRDAVAGRALARHAPRHGPLRLPERPHPLARRRRRTRRRTARSAASARRRRCSPRRCRWSGSRRSWGSTRSRSGAGTRSGRARRCRWARRCARASARGQCSRRA